MPGRKKRLPPKAPVFPKLVQEKMAQYHRFWSIARELQRNINRLQKKLADQDSANQRHLLQEIQMVEARRNEFRERLRDTASQLPPAARQLLAKQLSRTGKELE